MYMNMVMGTSFIPYSNCEDRLAQLYVYAIYRTANVKKASIFLLYDI